MAVTNREFWDLRVKIRAQFTKLAEQIANIDTSGGGGISELTSKMVVDALGYTPYNANNPADYITSAALTPYALKADIPSLVGYATEDFVNNQLGDYATKDFVDNKLVDYAPLTSVQGFENRIGGLEGAVPKLNERVTTVESKVSSLNELVSTGENNLLDRVNVIEEEYATKTYVDNAIDGIDLSAYLLKADLTKSRIQSTLGISDWALSATKPSYAWSEITSRPTALSQFTDDVVAGKYLPQTGGIIRNDSHAAPLTLASSKETYTGMRFINKNNESGYLLYTGGSDYGVTAANWSATYTLIHSGNIGNYNAGSATKLQKPRKLWGKSFDGTADVSGNLYSDIWRIVKDSGTGGVFFQAASYNNLSDLGIVYITARNGNDLLQCNIWATKTFLKGNVGIGNTSPAERLDVSGNIKASGNINATSVTIGGVTLSWDSVNNALVVNGNMSATGSITAKKSV